ncbi:GTPase Era [Desulfoferrobacter suflitae]|uniref:GTPase Era n=1 Tax=Desulfoferrobacter suflitae TaxID=2865782 RepID=UPI002164EFAC|nr:GTPase Era [Desulfoferrobacter suflitae]MCK8603095.1 GTPase Era [Desulfoferrobacter suflitae]
MTEQKAIFRSGYVALVGAPNVGKSTLLNQILQEKISITAPKPQTTRNRILGIMTGPSSQMIFVDTPGIHRARDRFNQILVDTALAALNDVDVICFLIETGRADHPANEAIIEAIQRLNTPVIVAVNKIDTVRNKQELLPVIDRFKGYMKFRAIVPISALLGDGVYALLTEIEQVLPEGPAYYPEDYLTDQPERFLVAELIREKVFHLVHQEIPYAVAVTVEQFSEDQQRHRIHIEAVVHVERDSQKAIIIGKQGQMLKEIGKQARKDIEALLGCRVYLGLFVRVQKNWRKNPRVLAEFGYGLK